MADTRHQFLMRLKPAALAVALAWPAFVCAQMPTGPTVVVPGSATINASNPNNYVITQSGNKAIINWDSFSIGAGNSVQFVQPGSNAVVLNRVVGNNVSQIFGSMSSNGQIFLVNPNGIYFAPGATLDVGGLVATTLSIRDSDFLAGRYLFTRGDSAARAEVINAGMLKARDGGYIVLAGDYAANRGVIEARLGTVMLGSAASMTLDINGDSLVSYALNERNLTELAGVENSGQLMADGGRVVMTAMTARSLTGAVVNNTGVIQARGVEEKGGAVYLLADDAGISLGSTSNIDVSGTKGGGTVLVGGNWQGSGSEVQASRVTVAENATIKADATGQGDGGKVVLWSTGSTNFQGKISARGGAAGGNGGNVEVSGKQLGFGGTVDTRAAKGATGVLLLDPTNITISTAADSDITAGTPFGDASTTAGTSNLNVTTLQNALAGSNVVVTTTSPSADAGNITVQDALTWSSGNMLTLQAANQILINATIAGGSGTLVLNAGGGVSQSAAISVSKLALLGSGNFNLSTQTNTVNTLAASVTGNSSVVYLKNSAVLNVGSAGGVDGVSVNTLRLNQVGDITQSQKLAVTNLEVVSTSGTTDLSGQALGSTVANVAADTQGAFTLTATGDVNVANVGSTNGIDTHGRAVTLGAGGAITQSQAIKATALTVNGGSTVTLANAGNDVDSLAGSASGNGLSFRDANALELGAINTNNQDLYLSVGGNLTQTTALSNVLRLRLSSSSGTVSLTNTGNQISYLTLDTHGATDLVSSRDVVVSVVSPFSNGVNTNGSSLSLKSAGHLAVRSGGISTGNGAVTLEGTSIGLEAAVNAGSGTVTLKTTGTGAITQNGAGKVTADKLSVTAGSALIDSAASSVNTLAVSTNGTGAFGFQFLNDKAITIGTVGALSGIVTSNQHAKVQAYGNITLANNVNTGSGHFGMFAQNGNSYANIDTSTYTITAGALAAAGNSVNLDNGTKSVVLDGTATNVTVSNANNRMQTKVIAVRSGGSFTYDAPNDLTISSNVWSLSGVTAANGHVFIRTGQFSGYALATPYSNYYDSATGKYKAGLVLEGGINATGSVYLYSDSGIFQWTSNNAATPPSRDGAAKIVASQLMVGGEGQFSLLDPKNAVRNFTGKALGTIMFATSTPLTIDSLTFNGFGVNKTINGVTTDAALISGSVAAGDAQYSTHNILLAAADDPGGSSLAMDIKKDIVADSRGGSTINISVGASDTHKDALVRTNGGVIRGNLLVLGANADRGKFELTTNVSSLSAAGGQSMVIDNSAYTGVLNVLGLGSAQGGGTPTPVGNVFLTTGGDMLLLGGKSTGDYLQLRADKLDVFGDMEMKDGARVLLQPYHMSNNVGVHNALTYLGAVDTNYSRTTLQKFSQTAAIYVGSTPEVMNQSAAVPTSVKNLNLTGYIRLGADGDGGLKMGYRSLSAQTSYTNAVLPSIWAGFIGDVYNLRLVGSSVNIKGFNVTGNQVHIFTDKLTMDEAADNYKVVANKGAASDTVVTLRSYSNPAAIWVGNTLGNNGGPVAQIQIPFSLLRKFPDYTKFVISGSTDSPLQSTSFADILLAYGGQESLGNRTLALSTPVWAYGYNSGGYNVFGHSSFTLASWNANSLPKLTAVASGPYNSTSGVALGAAGGLWGGCPNLTSCQATNISVVTGVTTTTTTTVTPGGGGGTTGTGGTPNPNPLPPATGPTPITTIVTTVTNTGTTPNTGGTPTGTTPGGTPGGTPGINDGMSDGGPSGTGPTGIIGTGTTPTGTGPTSTGTDTGTGTGTTTTGTGINNGPGTTTTGTGTGTGTGTITTGTGIDTDLDGMSGSGGGLSGGGGGTGTTGTGTGTGTSGNGNSTGTGSGTGGSGTGSGSGTGTGSSDGTGTGTGTGSGSGSGSGNGNGNGNGNDGSGSGSGSKSGQGSGSGSGTGGDDGSSGSGSGRGTGSGSSDGDGNGSGSGSGKGKGSGSGTGTGAGSGTDDGSGADDGSGSGGSGSGRSSGRGSSDSDGDGSGSGSGKGKGSGSGAGSGSGSGSGDGSGADDDSGTGGSGSGRSSGSGSSDGNGDGDGSGSGSGKGKRSGGSGDDDGGSGSGKSGRADGKGDKGGDGSGSGDSDADGAGSGRDGNKDGSGKGGDGAGKGDSSQGQQERFCVGQQGTQQRSNRELPDQGGALATRPLVEVRNGGVNMDGGDCSKQQQASGGSGSGATGRK